MNFFKKKSGKGENENKLTLNMVVCFKRLFFVNYSPRYIRFKGDLCTYKTYLENLNDGSETKNDWKNKALKHCEKAKEKLDEKRIDEGWKLLHKAKRLEVYSGKEFRNATIIQLREECVKLREWRKNAIQKIIGVSDDDKKKKKVLARELEKALEIRDTFHETLYYTNRLTRGQFNWLAAILLLLVILIFVYVIKYEIEAGLILRDLNFKNLSGVLLFGLLGATTSTIFHFRKSQGSARIPEIISNNSITFSRILVGAGFSVFIFVFLNSEIAKAIKLFSFEVDSCFEFFTIAFVSGFSERLALSSIQKIIGKKE